jgi:hypothetical protein
MLRTQTGSSVAPPKAPIIIDAATASVCINQVELSRGRADVGLG